MTATTPRAPTGERILGPTYAATTIGMFALIAFIAFEALALVTVMPTIAADLDGVGLFALAFAAPLATGVIGMVASGMWSDGRGPGGPLKASMVVFALGLLVCGTAPTMEVLVAGRLLQGLGGGALIVGVYVVVGLRYPAALQPAVFASFAAAWVLPSLFGPAIAAGVSGAFGWRWVFLAVVGLVGLAGVLITPTLRGLPTQDAGKQRLPWHRLVWAVVAATAVLAVELLGSTAGALALLAVLALAVLAAAIRPLLPAGTLMLARGLPATIGTRGLLAASFFVAEAYIAFVLQDRWDLSPGHAGIALTVVGIVWAGASQVQAWLGDRISNARAMRVGTQLVLLGTVALTAVVWWHGHPALAVAAYAVAGAGMGFGYPRTGVAMLAASGTQDRGFNSSALSIADSLGGALALALSGVAFAVAERAGGDPFLAAFGVAVACAVVGVAAGRGTAVPDSA